MTIKDIKLRDKDKILYIFEFETKEEYNTFFSNLDVIQNEAKEGSAVIAERLRMLSESLKSRCSSKYARKGCAVSTSLFQDEMITWFYCLYDISMALIRGKCNEVNKISDEYSRLTSKYVSLFGALQDLDEHIEHKSH